MKLYPLVFEPNRHTALWGHEEWLVSGHPSSPSCVANGPLKGRALDELTAAYGRVLTGTAAPSADTFPLLFKIIDAQDRLSVQVHPNNANAALTGVEPKTEMWCVLRDGASIFAGLKPGTTPGAVEQAVRTGRFEDLVAHHEAATGDVFFIPGGLVHAIGTNTLLYEVQQSSNTTYRLYDWGRVGKDGQPRPLHVAESLKTIDFSLPVPQIRQAVECPYFRFEQQTLSTFTDYPADSATFRVLFVAAGSVRVVSADTALELDAHQAVLIPAGVACRVEPFGPAQLLSTVIS